MIENIPVSEDTVAEETSQLLTRNAIQFANLILRMRKGVQASEGKEDQLLANGTVQRGSLPKPAASTAAIDRHLGEKNMAVMDAIVTAVFGKKINDTIHPEGPASGEAGA